MAKVFEVEIYHKDNEFAESEYDIYANYPDYETAEFHTTIGLESARKLAKELARKYKVDIRENIDL